MISMGQVSVLSVSYTHLDVYKRQVLGLASLIIGQSVISRGKSGILRGVVAVVVGSLIYRAIYAVALKFNVTTYLKLITAVIVALALSLIHI